jgi:hypothetical protein
MAFIVLESSNQVHAIAAGGTNAQHTLPTAGGPTAGTFTLSFGGFTTTPIQWNDTAANVSAALKALPSITTTGVLVTGGPLNTTDIVINYIGPLANSVVALPTVNAANLTGTLVPASTTTGVVTAAKVTNEMGSVPSSMAQATWTLGKMSFVSPTAVTGATAQCFVILFLQFRAGAQLAILGGYSTVAGNSLVANTEVVVPTFGAPSILASDVLVCQTQMTGGTGLAVPIGISAKAELE